MIISEISLDFPFGGFVYILLIKQRVIMKKTLLFAFCLWCLNSAFAASFEVGGIRYNIIPDSKNVEVTSKMIGASAYTGEIVIPSSVTYDGASYNVTAIGYAAFDGNRSAMTSITIPSTVTSIGGRAFSGCKGLTGISIPSSVTSIGEYAFSGCTGLTSITIPSSVTSMGGWVFSSCSSLTDIAISSSLTTIVDGAFIGCRGLKSVVIPSSLTSIGAKAFQGCTGLTGVAIPSSVTSIANDAFDMCRNIMNYEVNAKNPTYSSVSGVIFNKQKTALLLCPIGKRGDYVIPSSVTMIGDGAFSGCLGLVGVTIPSTVTSIGYRAFSSCSGLMSVTIPSSVTFIGEEAFVWCRNLTSIKIPSSVTSIGSGAFGGCNVLNDIEVEANNTNYLSEEGVVYNKQKTTLVAYPSGRNGEFNIPSFVTSIGDKAFFGCTMISGIRIPSSVTSIGTDVFSSCNTLKSLFAYAETPAIIGTTDFELFDINLTLYVPKGSRGLYRTVEEWNFCPNIEEFDVVGLK